MALSRSLARACRCGGSSGTTSMGGLEGDLAVAVHRRRHGFERDLLLRKEMLWRCCRVAGSLSDGSRSVVVDRCCCCCICRDGDVEGSLLAGGGHWVGGLAVDCRVGIPPRCCWRAKLDAQRGARGVVGSVLHLPWSRCPPGRQSPGGGSPLLCPTASRSLRSDRGHGIASNWRRCYCLSGQEDLPDQNKDPPPRGAAPRTRYCYTFPFSSLVVFSFSSLSLAFRSCLFLAAS